MADEKNPAAAAKTAGDAVAAKKPASPLLNMDGITVAKGNTVHYGLDGRMQSKAYGPGETPPYTEEDADHVIELLQRGVLVDVKDGDRVAAAKLAVPKAGSDKEKT